jgi:hypothetical protein
VLRDDAGQDDAEDDAGNSVTAYPLTALRRVFACMSLLARMVVPGLPHHVTQRGNRREAIFFEAGDQQLYCDVLAGLVGEYPVHYPRKRRAEIERA